MQEASLPHKNGCHIFCPVVSYQFILTTDMLRASDGTCVMVLECTHAHEAWHCGLRLL